MLLPVILFAKTISPSQHIFNYIFKDNCAGLKKCRSKLTDDLKYLIDSSSYRKCEIKGWRHVILKLLPFKFRFSKLLRLVLKHMRKRVIVE